MVPGKKLFAATQLGTSATALYTVPDGKKCHILRLILCNTDDTAEHTATVYLVPSGGTAGADNQLCKVSIPADDYAVLDPAQVLDAGDSIQALADAASVVTAHGSGIEGDA